MNGRSNIICKHDENAFTCLHFHVVMRLVFGILFPYFVRVIEINFQRTNSKVVVVVLSQYSVVSRQIEALGRRSSKR